MRSKTRKHLDRTFWARRLGPVFSSFAATTVIWAGRVGLAGLAGLAGGAGLVGCRSKQPQTGHRKSSASTPQSTAATRDKTDETNEKSRPAGRKHRFAATRNSASTDIPPPATKMTLDTALTQRRSVRAFADKPLSMQKIRKLAWSAQGITAKEGYRTCPSAGALYPLELYIATTSGVYHYVPKGNTLKQISTKDLRRSLAADCLGQQPVAQAAAVFVLTAVFERTRRKYGNRAKRYVYLEAGHCAQNILLEVEALHLAAYPVGAFVDARVAATLSLPQNHKPVYIVPIGHPR
jgi:SagB-type dehydrogenase family enzyme